MAGPVHDAGWNCFFTKLWYKAASGGRELVKVDPRGTSQVCVCGAAVPKTLAERWHACPVCGLSAPRDVVSAQVILQRARIGRSRHNVEDVVSCVPREAVAFSGDGVITSIPKPECSPPLVFPAPTPGSQSIQAGRKRKSRISERAWFPPGSSLKWQKSYAPSTCFGQEAGLPQNESCEFFNVGRTAEGDRCSC